MQGIIWDLVDRAGVAGHGEAAWHRVPGEARGDAARGALEGDVPQVLVVHCRSARRLGAPAEGMVAGAGTHARESVAVTPDHCMLSGDDHCTLRATSEVG